MIKLSLRWLTLLAILCDPVLAVILDIGKVSVIDGPAPGSYVVLVENITGDPLGGGTALPPDFPVFTLLTFQNPVLTVTRNMVTEVYGLPDAPSGSVDSLAAFDPLDPLNLTPFFFVDDEVTNLTLTATVSPLSVVDYLGNLYQIDSSALFLEILPAPGNSFIGFGDTGLLQVQANTVVPEPSTWAITGLFFLAGLGLRHRRLSTGRWSTEKLP